MLEKRYITPLSESSVVVLIYFINPIESCVYSMSKNFLHKVS